MTQSSDNTHTQDIAVIGWQIRFPGADSIEAFWQNLSNGVESVSFFNKDELIAGGFTAEEVNQPNFVNAGPMIPDIESFDAEFFGFSPRDAEVIDPQFRIFLELSWAALENAGYDAETYPGRIGVFGGANISRYYMFNLMPAMRTNPPRVDGGLTTQCFNDKDALATLVSYKLNLKGPSVNVQSFCSTSLVAVHLACQSLRLGESDMVLAGGTNINGRNAAGYLHHEGDILSPDGHCRTFDKDGQGTLFGSGAGIVVLKRLVDAQRDGDTIQGIIKGSAINNDGSNKAGYTAPSVAGQTEAVKQALKNANVSPETISYVEAHGTATNIGDPIEVEALTQAYRTFTDRKNYCAIGSVKTNLGHLDRAAGMPSLIKSLLAAQKKQLPPNIHFVEPNPKIDFENSPFYVCDQLTDWQPPEGAPRRAGISALGFGGTNAHIIIEEAPGSDSSQAASTPSTQPQLLVLSARTETALEQMSRNLAQHIQKQTSLKLTDIAHTLQIGRRPFACRKAIVCHTPDDAIDALEGSKIDAVIQGSTRVSKQQAVTFMFSGQGAQYVNMGRDLYENETVFQETVDQCAELLTEKLGCDLREVLYPQSDAIQAASEQLKQTAFTQPALFTVEYALAQLLLSWGIQPNAMIGHSIGEYVAACIAGVFTLEDALNIVALRGKLMQSCEPGDMLAVSLSEDEALAYTTPTVSLAAVNAPSLCVLSGDSASISQVQEKLTADGQLARPLETSHAFHSFMMDGILEEFQNALRQITLNPPQMPYLSNVTGNWIQADEATDPNYWARHLRGTVRFAAGMSELFQQPNTVFLEVGPGKTLATFADRSKPASLEQKAISTLHHPQAPQDDQDFLARAIAQLWVYGTPITWDKLNSISQKKRVPLPTYPFERKVFWVDKPDESDTAPASSPDLKKSNLDEWSYLPSWKRTDSGFAPKLDAQSRWLIFTNDAENDGVAQQLQAQGAQVILVARGEAFAELDEHKFQIPVADADAYQSLLKKLDEQDSLPTHIIHSWNLSLTAEFDADALLDHSFYSLLYLAQALGQQELKTTIQIGVVTNQLHNVTGEAITHPEIAALIGPCKVISKEYAQLNIKNVDIQSTSNNWAEAVITELTRKKKDNIVAWRGEHRWVQTYELNPIQESADPVQSLLSTQDTYLITGGFGGIGKTVAKHLAQTYQANLALTTRSALPEKATWDTWLNEHPASDGIAQKIQVVRELEALGAQVLVLSADTTDLAQMNAAIETIEAKFHKLDGVFHTAGLPGGGIAQLKTREVADKVLKPKVHGTLILETVLQQRSPKFVLLFSSIASVIGPFGQVDYAAANAFMDSIAAARNSSRSDTLWAATNWDDWAEVGMAVETSLNLGLENAQLTGTEAALPDHPLFQKKIVNEKTITYIAELNADRDWVLFEHLLFEQPTLPGSAYLEFARSAYAHATETESVHLRDLFILNTFPVAKGTQRSLHVELNTTEDGHAFTIKSQDPSDASWIEHARGMISPSQTPAETHSIAQLKEQCNETQHAGYAEDDLSFIQAGSHLSLGPRWHNTRELWMSAQHFLGHHRLHASMIQDVQQFALHPAFTDFTALFPFNPVGAYVPFSYQSIDAWAPLEADIHIYVEALDAVRSGNQTLRFNAYFLNNSGKELAVIRELTLRRVDSETKTTEAESTPQTLMLQTPGLLNTLAFQNTEKAPPAPGQVEVKVVASGLNFRDVLRGLGMLSSDHDAGIDSVGFGTECSGIITAVGDGVTTFKVGDEVLALSPFGFSTHLNIPQEAVALIPDGISFEEAASIPLIFLTVHHGMHKLARLQKDERLLIHAATGGIGLATIQYAQHVGAEIYATAGSPRKHAYLRKLGIENITTSRDLSFAEDIQKWTHGEGVDVVFNALAGEFLTKSLDLLRPFGRFIEIGAKDIYQNSPIGLRPFANNLTFSAFDLGQISAGQPEYLKSLLEEVMSWFKTGKYQPLPIEVFAKQDIADAFQYMAAAKHIGKVVVTLWPQARKKSQLATAKQDGTTRDLSHAILPHEGIQIIEKLLSSEHAQVAICTRDLQPLIKMHESIVRDNSASAASQTAGNNRKQHPRPNLATPFLAPRNETESKLAEIWQNLLGVEAIGVHDSFFELGGDSLIGVQLISQIKDAFTQEISTSSLYEDPTIAAFAKILNPEQTETKDTTVADRQERIERRRERRKRRQ